MAANQSIRTEDRPIPAPARRLTGPRRTPRPWARV